MNKALSLVSRIRRGALLGLAALLCAGNATAEEIYSLSNGFDTEWQVEGSLWRDPQTLEAMPPACQTELSCVGASLVPQPNVVESRLISPEIDLPPYREDARLHLQFSQWYRFGPDEHEIAVEISSWSGDSWRDWRPLAHLTRQGGNGAWRRVLLDLAEFAGQRIRLSFRAEIQAHDDTASRDASAELGQTEPGQEPLWILADVVLYENEADTQAGTVDTESMLLAAPSALMELSLEDFETGAPDWQIDNGEWEIGTPTSGPGDCFGGSQCVGTVLDGYYAPEGDSRLISPIQDLPADLGADERLELRFWEWYAYSGYGTDRGSVDISVWDGAAWSDWQSLQTPAPESNVGSTWSRVAVDLSAYAGQRVRIAFHHYARDTSAAADEAAGWFVDDVELWRGVPDVLTTDFESGQGDWSTDAGLWAWGTPSYVLAGCYSGDSCIGTVLDSSYPPNSDSRLISPAIRLPDIAADDTLLLRFWQWFVYSSRGTDRGEVMVRRWQQSKWADWESALITAPEASQSEGWEIAAVNLDRFAGDKVQVAFEHYARDTNAGTDEAAGWFIDDVALSHFSPTGMQFGESTSGSFDGAGDRQYYAVEIPPNGHLQIGLDILDDQGIYEVFVRCGALPTLGQYDSAFAVEGGDGEFLIANAPTGTCYVMLYADSLGGGSGDYQLQVDFNTGVFITGITPERVGNTVPTTFTLDGAGFSPSSTVSLVDSATTVPADSLFFVSAERLEAEIDVTALSAGTYALRVETGEYSDEIEFELVDGGEAVLETNLVVPSRLGYHALATIYVEYTNTGDLAMPAPLLVLTATQINQPRAIMRLGATVPARAFWTSAMPQGFSNSVQFLASGESAGVLQPGESQRVAIQYAGWQQPWNFSYPPISFTLGVLNADDDTPVDWGQHKTEMRPDGIPEDAWDALWESFVAEAGSTWGDYVSLLTNNARYLSRLGQEVTDIAELLSFEFDQADGPNVIPEISVTTDTAVDAAGMDLVFFRSFPSTITGRHDLGALGRGWRHNWDVRLTQDADGTVTIQEATGGARIFQPDSRYAGVYFAMPGDLATLTESGGAFILEEASGTTRAFTADGRLDFLDDTNGNRITAGYDGDRLTGLTHSSGPSLALAYNGSGRIENVSASDGETTRFAYDADGEHLLSATYFDGTPLSYTVAYTYHGAADGITRQHALTGVTLPGDVQQVFSYDDQGRLATHARNDGAERIQLTYDDEGRVSIQGDVGGTFDLFFDHRGLVARAVDPHGSVVQLDYDANRDLIEIADAIGRTHRYSYDDRGNLVQLIGPLGNTTRFGYDGPFDRMTSLLDANGNQTLYDYDAAGSLVAITYDDDSQESWTYDAQGNPTAWTTRRENEIGYSFDSVSGRLLGKELPDGSTVTYEYDERDNLATVIDSVGTTTFEYYADNRLQRITFPGNRTLEYTYNATGQRASSTNQLGHRLDYHYDNAGRLERISDETSADIVHYQYDAAGRLTRKELGNGVYTEYGYDDAWQLISLVNYKPDDSVLSQFLYAYDERGRRIGMTTLEGEWLYSYDDLGQLIGWIAPDGRQVAYEYDPLGNRISVTDDSVTTDYTTNGLNQYTRVGETDYEYDADGNLIRKEGPEGITTYTYDDENRLVAVSSPEGNWLHMYDGLNNRVRIDNNGEVSDFVIDPMGLGNLVGEYDAVTGAARAVYAHGIGLLSRKDATGINGYYSFDAIGNTRELTDGSANVLNQYDYLPFGEKRSEFETFANRLEFIGEYGVATENERQTMRARDYDSYFGAFLSVDPLRIGIVDPNLYRYTLNNPISAIDPTGLRTCWLEWEKTGAHRYVKCSDGDEYHFRCKNVWNPLCLVYGPGEQVYCHDGKCTSEDVPYSFFFWNCLQQSATQYCMLPPSERGRKPERPQVTPPSNPPATPGGTNSSASAGSGDPNEKTGPATYGEDHYIAAGSVLPYRIDFENEEDATAPAQIVTITDPLDSRFHWSSFELTEIGFGDERLDIPAGSQHYEARVPMSYGGVDFEVLVEAGIRLGTGEIYANFYSLDPLTGLPPAVDIGFLPPEDGTGRGQGFISYIVYADQDLPSGTELRNVAYITFDGAETIATNQVDPHDPSQGTDPEKEVPITIAPPFADLTISAGAGGSVTTPGEGQFQFEWGETVPIRAVGDGGDSWFVGWGGDIDTVADPSSPETTIGMYDDFTISASFLIAEPVTVPWTLQPGFNLVAMPHDPRVPDLADRMDEIGTALTIERLQALDKESGLFSELSPGEEDNPSFLLTGGEGLVVYAAQVVDEVRTSLGCPDWNLDAGVNFVGGLCMPPGTTAFGVLEAIGGETVVSSIIRFNRGTGRFESAAYADADPVGTDFLFNNGEGYIIQMKQDLASFRLW